MRIANGQKKMKKKKICRRNGNLSPGRRKEIMRKWEEEQVDLKRDYVFSSSSLYRRISALVGTQKFYEESLRYLISTLS